MKKDIDILQLRTVTAFLGNLIDVLSKRYDANVKASTDADANYAAEVADARVDACGNEKQSLGACIRDGQLKLDLQVQQAINLEETLRNGEDVDLQAQIDSLSHAVLDITTQLARINGKINNT